MKGKLDDRDSSTLTGENIEEYVSTLNPIIMKVISTLTNLMLYLLYVVKWDQVQRKK